VHVEDLSEAIDKKTRGKMFELIKINKNEDETRSTISGEELIGAEIIAATPFGISRKDDLEELAEIEVRLKDGRHLNLPAGREEIQIMELWDNNLGQDGALHE
jgi:hypothetical protein